MAETETRTLAVATGNAHKRSELEAMLAPLGVTVVLARDHGLGEVVEDGDTFAANALKKAREGYEVTGFPCLADDSGLEVDALGGAPGVRTARYAGEGCSYADNRAKMLAELAGVEDRGAAFRTVALIVWPDGEELAVEGVCRGTIAIEERGELGFGYDPIFIPDGQDAGSERTVAEFTAAEKQSQSHRARAFGALIPLLAGL
ncbi:MAG: RdgB/HAM1 family non-canonical purine NTP pyrophosphatase [Myxococcales bacterium]|nr:RdgB/HAM1 family non-canonical purine NTP pyrophosphatase [Myxococcales bacterium]